MLCIPVTTSSHSHSHSHPPALDHPHPHSDESYLTNPMIRIQRLGMFLEAHFGEVEYHMPEEELEPAQEEMEQGETTSPPHAAEPSFLIQLDEADARINLISMVRHSFTCPTIFPLLRGFPVDCLADPIVFVQTVESDSETVRKRVEAVLQMAVSTVSSLSETFVSGAPLELDEGLGEKEKAIQKGNEDDSPQTPATGADIDPATNADSIDEGTADIAMGDERETSAVAEEKTKPVDAGLGNKQEQPAEGDEGDEDAEGDDDDGDDRDNLQVHA